MISVAYGPHADQLVEFRGRDGDPLVVVIHGGYWRPATDRSHAAPMSEALAEAGFRVATIEYRRIPGDPDATVADVRAALALVGGPAVLVGHSAGGHLALLCAGEPGVRGVVALAPVADLALAEARGLGSGAAAAFLGGVARPDLDPALLPTPGVPVRILHGDADGVVPLEVAESYASRHPGVALEVLPGAGHFEVIEPESAEWAVVVEAIRAMAG